MNDPSYSVHIPLIANFVVYYMKEFISYLILVGWSFLGDLDL
jgi:hypothetical protein